MEWSVEFKFYVKFDNFFKDPDTSVDSNVDNTVNILSIVVQYVSSDISLLRAVVMSEFVNFNTIVVNRAIFLTSIRFKQLNFCANLKFLRSVG